MSIEQFCTSYGSSEQQDQHLLSTFEAPFKKYSELQCILSDLYQGGRHYQMWVYMAMSDIRNRYKRTILGPFWTTMNVAIFVSFLGVLFAKLWNMDVKQFLPFFASGYICWLFFSTVISDGCVTFIAAESLIKQVNLPYSIYLYSLLLRNLLVLGHHLLFYVLIVIFFHVPLNLNSLYFIPGMFLVCCLGVSFALLFGLICARFRDFQQVISNFLQLSMLVTPIFWPAQQMSGRRGALLVDANPLYHFICILREPLLGQRPTLLNFEVAIAIVVGMMVLSCYMFAKCRRNLVYWL